MKNANEILIKLSQYFSSIRYVNGKKFVFIIQRLYKSKLVNYSNKVLITLFDNLIFPDS